MSLDKSIESGKDRRKPYRKSKRHVKGCRCHGGCDYCLGNRMYKYKKAQDKADYHEDE